MCGIVGIINYSSPVDTGLFTQMRDTMSHRGPDDNGIWSTRDLKVALGHLRLSILDPTPAGHQPRIEKNGRYVITYNGEVYNYLEIRAELQNKGYKFETGTDTEVILQAYIEYGAECVQQFNGMFAIAIYDTAKNKLFLVRDRLGIKPLYYYHDDNQFIFASEIKAILKGLPAKPELNVELIDSYMSFGYVPGENTLHKGIKRLLPGHCMTMDVQNGINIEQYWDLHFNEEADKGFEHYLKQSQYLLEDSINLRLRSDVPLGIFLSGGIDSSAVVGLLADKVKEPLKTFSIAYDFGQQFDETHYAQMVAKQFKTDHHEIKISPEQFKKFIPEFIHLMDEPVTEAAAISLFFVAKLAKEKVTVALSGEGSDEIFAGYDLYHYMQLLEKYRSVIPGTLRTLFAAISSKLLGGSHKVSKYLNLALLPLEQRYNGMSTYPEEQKLSLYKDAFKELIAIHKSEKEVSYHRNLFSKVQGKDALNKMLYFDTKTWLVDDLLIKADRMSMATSIELRVPFLDYRLVEFAASIPSKYKMFKGTGKYILKKMMEPILPKEIIYRKKMGFPTPLKLMFQNELREYASILLLSDGAKCHQFFEKQRIAQLLEEHCANKYDHHKILWQLVVLEEWLKNNFESAL
jgi:asparagine synthase (glutamine-hydrolysing)